VENQITSGPCVFFLLLFSQKPKGFKAMLLVTKNKLSTHHVCACINSFACIYFFIFLCMRIGVGPGLVFAFDKLW